MAKKIYVSKCQEPQPMIPVQIRVGSEELQSDLIIVEVNDQRPLGVYTEEIMAAVGKSFANFRAMQRASRKLKKKGDK